MSRIRSAVVPSRRRRRAVRRARRLRRAAVAAIALASLVGVTTTVLRTQSSDARGMRSPDSTMQLGAARRWKHHHHARPTSTFPATSLTSAAPTSAPLATSPPTSAPATTTPQSTAPPATSPPTSAPATTPGSCAPITVRAGGSYSGCYASTSTGTPAVTLATSQPVTLDHARVVAKGFGIQDTVTGTRLRVVDTTFEQTDPGAVVAHRAIELQQPASFVAEHNRFTDGDGIWIGGGSVDPLTVRSNLAVDIGRYPHPTGSNCCVQFLQLDGVTSANGEIAWNHTQNTSGRSGVEDNINLFRSGGSDSAHRIEIHGNLIDGAYPLRPSSTNFTGGGILASDGTGSFGHTVAHDNTVVSTTNYGVAAAGGTDVHLDDNLLVNDTLGSDGPTHYYSQFGQAVSVHDSTASGATGNRTNWRRDSSATQFLCWIDTMCSGTQQVSTTEQQARDAWAASLPAAAKPIGPRP
jgi:hypothetical protein